MTNAYRTAFEKVLIMIGLMEVEIDSMTTTQMYNIKEMVKEAAEEQAKLLIDGEVHWVLSSGLPELKEMYEAIRYLELELNPVEEEEEPTVLPQIVVTLPSGKTAAVIEDFKSVYDPHTSAFTREVNTHIKGLITSEDPNREVPPLRWHIAGEAHITYDVPESSEVCKVEPLTVRDLLQDYGLYVGQVIAQAKTASLSPIAYIEATAEMGDLPPKLVVEGFLGNFYTAEQIEDAIGEYFFKD